MPHDLDLRFQSHGSVVGVTIESNEGDQWVTELVSYDPWAMWGTTLYIDARFAYELRAQAQLDGLRTN